MRKNFKILNSRVLLLGFTFKENCPDIRNTKVIDIYNELKKFEIDVDVYDPWANQMEVRQEYEIEILNKIPELTYSAIILAVSHKVFLDLDLNLIKNNAVVYDVKGFFPSHFVDGRL